MIQTWSNLIQQMRLFIAYGLFSQNEVLQSHSIDIQKQFKLWCNSTFRHHIKFRQYLKYDKIDSALCSCAHRPYKSSYNKWSLAQAIT
jgi:hypothetical protein